jgi:HSP20 family protein
MKKKYRFYWEEKPRRDGIKIGMPGFKKDEIHVRIDDSMLTIGAENKSHRKEKGKGFYREEASFNSFHRSVSLPEGVKSGDFDISISDGSVALKKKKKAKI